MRKIIATIVADAKINGPSLEQQDELEWCLTELDAKDKQIAELTEALETIHGIASEDFETPNQMELIRLTAAKHLPQ